MADEVVLLDFGPSPYAMRVRIALAEKGITYESKQEDLSNKSPLLLQMNPIHKKVPVLIHNGKPVSESLIVVQYIDEVWNDRSPLLPSDPYHRAQAIFWADYADKKIFAKATSVLVIKREELEGAMKELIANLKLLEEQLGEKPYFGGDELGFLDVALIPISSVFQVCEIFGNLKIEIECPKFFAWAKRCLQKGSVSKSIIDQQKVYEFVVAMRKKFGIE